MSLDDIKFTNIKKERKTTFFKDLSRGSFFKLNRNDSIYVKTATIIEDKYNALEMPYGLLARFEDNRKIEEVIIEEIKYYFKNE